MPMNYGMAWGGRPAVFVRERRVGYLLVGSGMQVSQGLAKLRDLGR